MVGQWLLAGPPQGWNCIPCASCSQDMDMAPRQGHGPMTWTWLWNMDTTRGQVGSGAWHCPILPRSAPAAHVHHSLGSSPTV